ncbi:MAG: hypothetical protein ACLURQ_18510 [Bacteroides thetaiotaomicron]
MNEADELEKEVTLTVKQEAAPEITDDRRGDSIAIVIASTKLRSMTNWDASERLDYWLGVTVWEKTDKGVTPEQLGRVRSVEFRMLNTKKSYLLKSVKLNIWKRWLFMVTRTLCCSLLLIGLEMHWQD